MGTPKQPPLYRILVYGIEKKGLRPPQQDIASAKYKLEFDAFGEAPRFQDFDGVIVFQGTFESFKRITGDYGDGYLEHDYDRDELDKRTKEALALTEAGGFLCMLLADPFIDMDRGKDYRTTDLSKRLLITYGIRQGAFHQRTPLVDSKVNELGKFFTIYGAAWSHLTTDYKDKDTKPLASYDNHITVGVVSNGNLFALPTLLPKTDDEIREYFTILSDGIVTLWRRLKADLPEWAREYHFPDEASIHTRRLALEKEIDEVDTTLVQMDRFKRVLVLQSEPLVDAVMEVFEKGLSLRPKREETFCEDLTLVDEKGVVVALVEVKGVTRGVAREYINQVDSHRERTGQPHDFPAILIINTNVKNAASLADKDKDVAPEQIRHAVTLNVLVIRTLDLLNLAALQLSGTLTSDQVIGLLTQSAGWLKADADGVAVRSE